MCRTVVHDGMKYQIRDQTRCITQYRTVQSFGSLQSPNVIMKIKFVNQPQLNMYMQLK